MAEVVFQNLLSGYRSEYVGITLYLGSFPQTSSGMSCCGDMHRYTPWCSLGHLPVKSISIDFGLPAKFSILTAAVRGCLAHCEATTCLWHGLWWLAVTTEGLPMFSTHSPEAWSVATIYSANKKLPFSGVKIKHIKMEVQILSAVTVTK